MVTGKSVINPDVSAQDSRRWVRSIVGLVVASQIVVVGCFLAGWIREPYPALVLPAFDQVLFDDEGRVTFLLPKFYARDQTGKVAAVHSESIKLPGVSHYKLWWVLGRLAAPKRSIEPGQESPWVLKDLRKTCATYYDKHVSESSVEILGHSAGGITYRHQAHRAPLAFRAILSLPQPSAYTSLARGFEGRCPCCRRSFHAANA